MLMIRRNNFTIYAVGIAESVEVGFDNNYFRRKSGSIHAVDLPAEAMPPDGNRANEIISTFPFDREVFFVALQRVVAGLNRGDLRRYIRRKTPGPLFARVNQHRHHITGCTDWQAAQQARERQGRRDNRAQAVGQDIQARAQQGQQGQQGRQEQSERHSSVPENRRMTIF